MGAKMPAVLSFASVLVAAATPQYPRSIQVAVAPGAAWSSGKRHAARHIFMLSDRLGKNRTESVNMSTGVVDKNFRFSAGVTSRGRKWKAMNRVQAFAQAENRSSNLLVKQGQLQPRRDSFNVNSTFAGNPAFSPPHFRSSSFTFRHLLHASADWPQVQSALRPFLSSTTGRNRSVAANTASSLPPLAISSVDRLKLEADAVVPYFAVVFGLFILICAGTTCCCIWHLGAWYLLAPFDRRRTDALVQDCDRLARNSLCGYVQSDPITGLPPSSLSAFVMTSLAETSARFTVPISGFYDGTRNGPRAPSCTDLESFIDGPTRQLREEDHDFSQRADWWLEGWLAWWETEEDYAIFKNSGRPHALGLIPLLAITNMQRCGGCIIVKWTDDEISHESKDAYFQLRDENKACEWLSALEALVAKLQLLSILRKNVQNCPEEAATRGATPTESAASDELVSFCAV
eukprot:TRINITY_DN43976_c0_g1_i1.p1 TRINITY_DN43976_c0_g1~~TRINITY_DN43976_c0_g1_i1.p1  ORF type:complete len:460 (-),score=58.56 TRINITY_DN43976_c0_g1_i1:144-1523(-)